MKENISISTKPISKHNYKQDLFVDLIGIKLISKHRYKGGLFVN